MSQKIYVNQSGVYNVVVKFISPQSNLAQAAANLYLNDELFFTLQTSGTEGRPNNARLRVELNRILRDQNRGCETEAWDGVGGDSEIIRGYRSPGS